MTKAQEQQKAWHDSKARDRHFAVNDSVTFRNYAKGDHWVQGCIIEQSHPAAYKVTVKSTDQVWHRHQDDIHKFFVDAEPALSLFKQC